MRYRGEFGGSGYAAPWRLPLSFAIFVPVDACCNQPPPV
jgi:hypothetical protein